MKRKRIVAITLSLVLIMTMAMPLEASAKPPWWNRFVDIVVADAVGALDGFVQTETLGGAIVGGIAGSLKEGLDQGISGGGWRPDEAAGQSVGLHHNLGLNFYFDQGAPERLEGVLLEYLVQQRIPVDQQQIQSYLRGLDPSLEELLRRIREGTTGPFNPNPGTSDDGHGGNGNGVIVSENFFPNLQRTLAILDGGADNPQQMLDEAIAFFLNASLRETDHDLRDDIIMKAQDYNSSRSNKARGAVDLGGDGTGLDFDKIKIIYEQQKSSGQPSDIILAWVFVDVLQQSSLYWSDVYCWGDNTSGSRAQASDNGSLWCWGANFERIMMDPEADPDTDDVFILVGDYLDLDDDGDTIPDFLDPDDDGDGIPTMDVKVILTLDQTRAMVNGVAKIMDTPAFVTGGRTLVPFRFIGEELGATIDWDPDARKVSYVRNDTEIQLWIGQNRATINGINTTVDTNPSVTPVIVNGRTVVPVRFISEALGAEVDWNPGTREVTITASYAPYIEIEGVPGE